MAGNVDRETLRGGVHVADVGLADAPLSGERREHLAQGRGADPARLTECRDRKRAGRVEQRAHHPLGDWNRCRGRARRLVHLKGEGLAVAMQSQGDSSRRRGGTLLDRERELVAYAAKVEVGITPGVKLLRAAHGLASAGLARAPPGVLHDHDGETMAALKLARRHSLPLSQLHTRGALAESVEFDVHLHTGRLRELRSLRRKNSRSALCSDQQAT